MASNTASTTIPFRVNSSAYTYFVGGGSCPAGLARSQGFLLYSTQTPLLDSRSQCTIILEKWYEYYPLQNAR